MQINLPEQGVQLHCSKQQIYQHPNQFVHKQGRGNQTRMPLPPSTPRNTPPTPPPPPPQKKNKNKKRVFIKGKKKSEIDIAQK